MEKLLTIIIAAYNEEKNIAKCMDSILDQTVKDFDVIIVNDGSKDNTLDKINEYMKKFEENNISLNVISKENGGLSSARNAGQKQVKTKYFCFLDSDDTIAKDYIEKIYDGLKKYDFPDIYKINLIKKDKDEKEISRSKKIFLKQTSGQKSFCKIAFSDPLFVLAQMYIIKNSYYNERGFSFTEKIYHEDYDLIPNVMIFAKTFATNNDYIYNYYEVEGSITNTTDPEKTIKKAEDVWKSFKKNDKNGKIYLAKEEITYDTYQHYMQYYAVGLLEKAKEIVSKKELLHENKEIETRYEKFMNNVYNGCIYANILLEGTRNSIKRFYLKYFLKYYLKDYDRKKEKDNSNKEEIIDKKK